MERLLLGLLLVSGYTYAGQKKSQKGAIRHSRRKFPWAQQYKICEISTHEKISLTDRRAQAYRHLGDVTSSSFFYLKQSPTSVCLPYQCSVQPDPESFSYKICRSGIID